MTLDESLALLRLPLATTTRWLEQLREPHRYYHTLEHVEAILARYHSRSVVIVAAAWLHDIVYDPKGSDNEERSAQQAMTDLAHSNISAATVARIIRDTKHHEGGDPWTDMFNDLDLAIIGSSPEAYDRYAQQIRLEYANVPTPIYNSSRAKILRHFDQRQIYKTPDYLRREALAHSNLKREIARLEAQLVTSRDVNA